VSTYIIVNKCSSGTAWYVDKIGCIFKVDKTVEFDKCYTIKLHSGKKPKAQYGFIDHTDAEVIKPNWLVRFAITFGLSN
jgi:hypothetical protein